jgi:hypothetical protein
MNVVVVGTVRLYFGNLVEKVGQVNASLDLNLNLDPVLFASKVI